MMKFDMPKEQPSLIKVIGVGGGGSNAVNHMYKQGIKGVDFIVCNTDMQSLIASPVPTKIQLGEGLGAGAIPEVGRKAAIEKLNEIEEVLSEGTKMVFITAGMGGGTGTGAAPIIAAKAKEMGILTVGIVTIPFQFEGKNRKNQADYGIQELKDNVDTLLIICNDRIREIYGNLNLRTAFGHADNVLTTAAKGIAEIITGSGYVNVDFNDVKTVMQNGGSAIMGYAIAEGDGRAIQAVEHALSSPLLNDSNIRGASQVLLYISSSSDENNMVTMDEIGEISDFIQDQAGASANIIFGTGFDDSLGGKLSIIVIATGYVSELNLESTYTATKVVNVLTPDKPKVEEVKPIQVAETKPELEIKLITREVEKPVEAKEEITSPVFQTVNAEIASTSTEEKVIYTLDDASFSTQTAAELTTEITATATATATATVVDTQVEEKTKPEGFNQPEAKPEVHEHQTQRASERIDRLRNLSMELKRKSVNEMINEPAYARRGASLNSTPHSSETHVSKYTLTENDGKTELKENNSFLHDNVD